MAPRVQSRADWRLFLLLVLVSGGSCHHEPATPEQSVDKSDPALLDRRGILYRDSTPFSGSVVERDGQSLVSSTPYRKGKRHGRAFAWYPGGQLAYEKIFRDGNREGVHRGYWPDGRLQFVYRYEHDLFEGEQVGYYKNGVQSELRHYHNGREQGRQTTWDGAGRVLSNYTFKGERRYGIVGRFDCVSVHE